MSRGAQSLAGWPGQQPASASGVLVPPGRGASVALGPDGQRHVCVSGDRCALLPRRQAEEIRCELVQGLVLQNRCQYWHRASDEIQRVEPDRWIPVDFAYDCLFCVCVVSLSLSKTLFFNKF